MTGPAPRLSVLVVSYGVRDLLARCLESVGGADEVIVVDNASADGSAGMVRERFPDVRLVAHSENRGFSVAVNRGAAEATGDAFLLLNPDATLSDGAIAGVRRTLERHPGASAVGFRQIDRRGCFQLTVGPPPWLSLDLARRLLQRRLDAGDQRLAALLDRLLSRPLPVPWVAGSSLLARRRAFEQIGGFDEAFFLFFEDIDFCLRLRAAGGRVLYDPSVTIRHERGASAARHRDLAERAYRASQLHFWRKHRGPWAERLVAAYQRVRGLTPE